jgi:hypothetical protein
MKGSAFIHDMMMIVGMLIIVFTLIYWSMNFGAVAAKNVMESSPLLLQERIAGYLSTMCVFNGDMNITIFPEDIPMEIEITEKYVQASTKGTIHKQEIQRGGSVTYERTGPTVYTVCDSAEIQKIKISFNPEFDKKIILRKKDNVIGIEAR